MSTSYYQLILDKLDALVKSRFIEMFGEISESRKFNSKIIDVSELFIDGDWIETKDQDTYGIRLIQTGNIGDGKYLDKLKRARFINSDTFEKLNCKPVYSGDVLISRLPDPIGRACIIPAGLGECITGVDCTILRLKDICNPEYFVAYTRSAAYKSQIKAFESGSTRKRISRKNLGKLSIPVPPIELQNEFADFVKQVDKSKFIAKQCLEKYDQLVKSRFIEMFGEESKFKSEPLSNNVLEMFIGPFGSSLKSNCFVTKEESYCMVYEQKHAIKKAMDLDTRYVMREKYDELKRFNIQPGDIIMSCRGTVGETYIVPDLAPLGIMHPSIMKIRLNRKSYNTIFFKFLLDKNMKKAEQMSKGSGVKMAITAKSLGKTYFIIPDISTQNEFADFVKQVDKSKFSPGNRS